MNRYVFDTSALLAYIENEEGATTVEDLLLKAILSLKQKKLPYKKKP